MTNEEFEKITSIKKEIDCLEKILYGYFGTSKNPTICNFKSSFISININCFWFT